MVGEQTTELIVSCQSTVRENRGYPAIEDSIWVIVNGQQFWQIQGGYTPFSHDIPQPLKVGDCRVTMREADLTAWTQPREKRSGQAKCPIDYAGLTG